MVTKSTKSLKKKVKEKKKYPKNERFQKVQEKIQETKTMSEYQILKRLQRLEHFIGCFPTDQIPVCKSFPSFFVLNTEKSNQRGSHWLAIREDEKSIEIYDSLRLRQYPDPEPDCATINDSIARLSINVSDIDI